MASVRGLSAGDPPINLRVHEIRCANVEGAREEFEDMLAALVRVTRPGAFRIQVGRGDGGIDVMTGDLRGGDIAIWQAKYFIHLGSDQYGQIRKSFSSALAEAGRRGNRITDWMLCVPVLLTRTARMWWETWREQTEKDTGVRIALWDATVLREHLIAPAAHAVRAHYYGAAAPAPSLPPAGPALYLPPDGPATAPPDAAWAPGDERRIGAATCFLHDDALETAGAGRAWLWREATADRLDGAASVAQVRVAQVRVLRATPAAEAVRAGLSAQARLLTGLAGRHHLPAVVALHDEEGTRTLITARPPGPTWREAYGPRPGRALDRITTAAVCATAVSLAEALTALHRTGHAHRATGPDTVVVDPRRRRAALRDGGLAALPRTVPDGPAEHRAPEQAVAADTAGGPDTAVDVYRFAALLHATLTGHPPQWPPLPVRATCPDLPQSLDDLLLLGLNADPALRPAGLEPFAAELRRVGGGAR
ncbi:serine/threonine protein kinase [Dactylosporangium siamense]|uniref:Protein kinase domain-containing protein n=1 Tax=Dactylosporangium siamense TaxID=685454 RepID=A0A919Q0C1_9ACTN|nr:serine/threonine-protein kinase [Dactylosporangium siamense]GIG52013.1 hypothetical protein Dsi01nite_100540 [Dactylosporangium siamense]